MNIFISHSSDDFALAENVCGLLEDSTLEGLKAYDKAYEEGIISPDFYTQKASNLNGLFCAQRSGIIFPRGEFTAIRKLNTEFEKANPGLKAQDCIDVCWILSPDGKVHGREDGNYYGGYYFSPKMSDEKFAKVLELAEAFLSLETTDECIAFFEDLFSPNETRSFCQRLEVAKLLKAGETYRETTIYKFSVVK